MKINKTKTKFMYTIFFLLLSEIFFVNIFNEKEKVKELVRMSER